MLNFQDIDQELIIITAWCEARESTYPFDNKDVSRAECLGLIRRTGEFTAQATLAGREIVRQFKEARRTKDQGHGAHN